MFRRLFQSVATAALRRKFMSLLLLHVLVVGAILLWPREQTALQAAPTAGDTCVDASASPLVGALPIGPISDTTVGQTDDYDLPTDTTSPTCNAPTTGTGGGPVGSLPRGAIYTGTGTAPDRAFSFTTDQSCSLNITMDPTGAQDLALIVYQSVCSSSLNDCVVVDDTGVGGVAETVLIDAIAGTEYFIVVDGYSTGGTPPGPSGPFDLSIIETTATGCMLTGGGPIYDVEVSADDATSGDAGTTVDYTVSITNTGNTTDTFDLSATGTWTTTVSAPTITLVAGDSGDVTVSVEVPANAAPPDSDVATFTATSQNSAGATDSANLTTSVNAEYGVEVSANDADSGDAGTTVAYVVSVMNTGNVTDTFDLTVAGTWTTTLSAETLNLGAGASGNVTVTVEIPGDAAPPDSDVATFTATSQSDALATDSNELTTSVNGDYGVDVSDNDAASGDAGTTVDYIVSVTNTGNTTDTFDLSATGTWTATVSAATINLASGASGDVTVSVEIPADAAPPDMDVTTFTATSQTDGSATDSNQLTTSVNATYGVEVSANDTESGDAGTTVDYVVSVMNTGNVADTFDLSATGTWTATVSAATLNLGAGASGNVTVTVEIPADAATLDSDVTTFTATSQSDASATDSNQLTTSVGAIYGVEVVGDDAQSGDAGSVVTYTIWITNAGNVTDTYSISVAGNTWGTVVSEASVELASGASAEVNVVVTIDAGAVAPDSDTATVTVTSDTDGSVTADVTLTTSVNAVGPTSYTILPSPL